MADIIKEYYLLCTAYNGERAHPAKPGLYTKKEIETYFVSVDRGRIAPAESVIGGADHDPRVIVL